MHRQRRRRLVGLCALTLLLPVAATSESAGGFAGTWRTSGGETVLAQRGLEVTGTYSGDDSGRLWGRVDGDRLVFRYAEDDETGEGFVYLETGGRTLRGWWRRDGEEPATWGEWTGTRTAWGDSRPPSFDGLYETSDGRMRLQSLGAEVTGTYSEGNLPGRLRGTVENGRLEVTWEGLDGHGEGWLELEASGTGLTGAWRAAGDETWEKWSARRIPTDFDRKWLVVLEASWLTGFEGVDYSMGRLLGAYLERYEDVEVRHRRFDDLSGFESAVRQLALLPGPVFVVVAAHGAEGGLAAGDDTIGPAAIGGILRDAPNVVGLHLSACEVFQHGVPEEIRRAAAGRAVAISGYAAAVDWSAAALVELLYLELVLARGLPPSEAARIVGSQLAFSGDGDSSGSPLGSAGFQLAPP